MPRYLMNQLKSEALSMFRRGKYSFKLFGLTFTIAHIHHNEFQVLLPDKSEVLRLIEYPRYIEVLEA